MTIFRECMVKNRMESVHLCQFSVFIINARCRLVDFQGWLVQGAMSKHIKWEATRSPDLQLIKQTRNGYFIEER